MTLQKLKQELLWFWGYAKCKFHHPIVVKVGMSHQFSVKSKVKVSSVVIKNITVFWNMTLHSLVDVYHYFKGSWFL